MMNKQTRIGTQKTTATTETLTGTQTAEISTYAHLESDLIIVEGMTQTVASSEVPTPSIASSNRSILQLPSDRPKVPGCASLLKRFSCSLPEALNRFAVEERSAWMVAAFNVLLHRYTQQQTIDIGVCVVDSNRKIIGLSTHLADDLTAQTLVSSIQKTIAQGQSTDLASSVLITLGQAQETPDQPKQTASLDLHLIISQDESCSSTVEYNANLFEEETIARWMGHFNVLLAGMIADRDQCLVTLPMLTPAEQHQCLVEWSSDRVEYAQQPLHNIVSAFAQTTPHAIAATCEGQQITYAELHSRSNQLAHYLRSFGVGPEVRVAVCVQPSLDIAIAMLGIFKAGGVYVPLDPTHPPDRLTVMLEDTAALVLLTQADLKSIVPSLTQQTLCLDRDWDQVAPHPIADLEPQTVSLDQTAYMIYTSGTTGKPKGVMATHRNLVNYILATQDRLGFNATDVMPSIARYTFSISIFEVLSPLAAGGTLVLLDREHFLDFDRLTETLEHLTMLHTVPSLMQQLVTYIRSHNLDPQRFHRLKHIFTGGDAVPAELLAALNEVFPKAQVCVLYGCSEISSLCSSYPVSRDRTQIQSRIGKPFNNVRVRLYDAHQNLVPIGVAGEIYVTGAGVTKGYLNRPDLTDEKFVTIEGERFYRTGDLGRLDREGNLEFLGRADFQIKLRGIRIELGDIETALRRIPGVRESVVVARDLGSGDQSLVAYVVLAPDDRPTVKTMRHTLRSQLPDYMVPSAIVILEAMPLNVNRKLDRKALPMPTAEDLAATHTYVAPRDPLEQHLVSVWESVLGIQPIGIQDPFADLGGNSLLAVTLVSNIQATLGQKLPLTTLLTAPTIEAQAMLLRHAEQSDVRDSLVLLREGGSAPPIFFIHDGDGEILLYQTLAQHLDPAHPVYGIQPLSRSGIPILHTRIPEIVDHYITQMQRIQPQGPYIVSGLCAGGILSFEIARQLQQRGQSIAMVGLLDAVDVEATERSGLIAERRLNNLSKALGQDSTLGRRQRLIRTVQKISQKACNALVYEVTSKVERAQSRASLKLFRSYLDRDLPIPAFLHNLPVRKVLQYAEKTYVPDTLYHGEVVLFRATQGEGADEPFIDRYDDPLFGWGKRVTQGVRDYEIPGGHSSMLQQPNVQDLAKHMQDYITTSLAALQAAPVPSLPPDPAQHR